LETLRRRLEKTQADYFRQIFEEAERGGAFGISYFEQRLHIGKVHNVINLPLKWYIGSYALYQDLVRKHLKRHFRFRPWARERAERAIFTVFNYDLQASRTPSSMTTWTRWGLTSRRWRWTGPRKTFRIGTRC